jgi:hypothetical protein
MSLKVMINFHQMKSFFLGFLFSSVIVPLLLAEEESLINNSSFEDGINSWIWGTQNLPEATGEIDDMQANSGTHSFRITNKNPAQEFAVLGYVIKYAKPGKYRLALWVKGSGVKSPDAMQISVDSAWKQRINFPQGDFDWKRIYLDYEVSQEAEIITPSIIVNGEVDKVWIDDVTFTRIQDIGQKAILDNAGFEGELYPWEWYSSAQKEAEGKLVKDVVHSGLGAFEISSKGFAIPGTYSCLKQIIRGAKKGNHRFSIWAKGSGIHSAKAVQLVAGKQWSERADFPSGNFNWKEISLDYEVMDEGEDVELVILVQDSVDHLWIDDASFQPVRID